MLKKVLKNRKISMQTKIIILDATAMKVLKYGSELGRSEELWRICLIFSIGIVYEFF